MQCHFFGNVTEIITLSMIPLNPKESAKNVIIVPCGHPINV